MSVVEFPTQERLIWVCGCGCCTAFVYQDGSAECTSCGATEHGHWSPPPDLREEPEEAVTINRIGEPIDIIRRRFDKLMSEETLLAAVQIFSDGRVHTLIKDRQADTDEQKAWWRRRAVEFLRHIFN